MTKKKMTKKQKKQRKKSLKNNLLDTVLLKNRNSIAHGEYVELNELDFNELHTEIISVMDDIKNRLSNLVVLETYKRGS